MFVNGYAYNVCAVLLFFSVDKCRRYCVTRKLAADNISLSSGCATSRTGSASEHISLSHPEDSISANCCAAGSPLPYVGWRLCPKNRTRCSALTAVTQSTAELELAAGDLNLENGLVSCVAEYLDVVEDLWTISVSVQITRVAGKTYPLYRCGHVTSSALVVHEELIRDHDFVFGLSYAVFLF